MVKNEVAAYLIMENTTDPVKPKNIQVFDKNNLFYLRFDTVLQTFNTKNRNGRIYAGNAMIPSLQAEHLQELMRKKSWFGEAGHPSTDDIKRILTIDPKLMSHKMVNIDVNSNMCRGTIETLDDDAYGRMMTKAILQGMEPAFSLRALASLVKKPNGDQVVQSKAHVVTYDWVILPSHKEAYRDESKPIQKIVTQIGVDGNTVKESMLPVHESMIKELVSYESKNVKLISNVCEVALESMQLSEDLRNVVLKEGNRTYIVPLEEKIKHDIHHYMRGL